MATASETSNLHVLSRQLEADIHARGLREGDRYLTANEVGQLLGVSTTTAHRTLRLLADSDWVVRRRKSGTFVGSKAGNEQGAAMQTVRVLLSIEHRGLGTFSSDELMSGIRRVVAGASVQFDFVPSGDRARYMNGLLQRAEADSSLLGFIAVSCTQDVYRRLAEAAVPTVVIGSLYLGGPDMPSIDTDCYQMGRLLARHLVDGGHRRLAICSFSESRPGDNRFYEGVSDVLTEARLPHNALRLLAIPRDTVSFEAAVRHLLQRPEHPTALMTTGDSAAETAARIAEQLGLKVPDDIEIVFRGNATPAARQSPHSRVEPVWPFERMAESAARMLDRLARGLLLDEQRIVVPVRLREAPRGNNQGVTE